MGEDQIPFVAFPDSQETNDVESDVIESVELTVDQVLDRIGFGRYQFIVLTVFLFFGIFHAYPTLVMVFGDDDPPWKCAVPFTNSSGLNATRNNTCRIEGIVQFGHDKFHSRCDMRREDWIFAKPTRYSMVTEFDLVCDKAVWNAIGKSVLFVFWGFGCLFLGQLADLFGRKPVFYSAFTLMVVFGTLEAAIASMWQFIVLRICLGLAISQFGLTYFIIVAEAVAPRQRAWLCNVGGLFFSMGLLLLDMQSYFVPDWRNLQLITTAPYIVLLLSWCFIPESPRWLLASGKFERAYKLLSTITETNRMQLGAYTLYSPTSVMSRKPPCMELLRNSTLRKRTLLQCISWFVVAMTYYGVSLAASDLGGNLYTNFALVTMFEVPAVLVSAYFLNRFGRRRCVVISMLLSGVACILVAVVPLSPGNTSYHLLRVSFGMSGKFFSTFAFGGYYIWCAELYPTTIRSRGVGIVVFFSRFGAASSPFVVDFLRKISPSMAFVFMGACCIGAAILSSFLPETNRKPTVETIEDLSKDGINLKNGTSQLTGVVTMTSVQDFDSEFDLDLDSLQENEEEKLLCN